MSLNEPAMQNVWRQHFLQPTFSAARGPIGEGGDCGTPMATDSGIVGLAALWKFYKRDRFLTAYPMAHIWLTFYMFFLF